MSRAYQGEARDHGTPELRRHKIMLINGSDPALSATLSGILFARGVLDDRQYWAAIAYRSARAAVFGAVLRDRDPNRRIPDDARVKMLERRFDQMARKLTVGQKVALTSISLDLWPLWAKRQLLGLELGEADQIERKDLLDGLDALAGDMPAEAPTKPASEGSAAVA